VGRRSRNVPGFSLISLGIWIRDFYLASVVRNPYYAKASSVMRETYRNIVGLDLRENLLKVSDELVLIYGDKDTATPRREKLGNTLTGAKYVLLF